ncbi:unannotated protein [freshwater metagenome]|uniref:Unannotated protein n=1 Tax=freshwater metagenome TaxID=449393 RepID=A0A6J6JRT4_9ZZZZ
MDNFINAVFFADAFNKFGVGDIALYKGCVANGCSMTILESVEDNNRTTSGPNETCCDGADVTSATRNECGHFFGFFGAGL